MSSSLCRFTKYEFEQKTKEFPESSFAIYEAGYIYIDMSVQGGQARCAIKTLMASASKYIWPSLYSDGQLIEKAIAADFCNSTNDGPQ